MKNLDTLMQLSRAGQTTIPVAWHYTNRFVFESILKADSVWASDVATMNDPRELEVGRLAVQGALKRAGLPTQIEEAVQGQLDFSAEVMDRGKTFVLSASSNGDSLPMWNEYGEHRQGYAIGFGVPGEVLNLLQHQAFDPATDPDGHGDINQNVSIWRDVIYDPSEHAREADAFIDLLARLVEPGGYDPSLRGHDYNGLLARAYTPPAYAGLVTRLKHPDWAYEEEVRITATASDVDRFHTLFNGRAHVNLTGWARPAAITGTSSYLSPTPTPLPIVAVRSGPHCPHTDLRALLDANGYSGATALTSRVAIRPAP